MLCFLVKLSYDVPQPSLYGGTIIVRPLDSKLINGGPSDPGKFFGIGEEEKRRRTETSAGHRWLREVPEFKS